jgi:hypothetical protein
MPDSSFCALLLLSLTACGEVIRDADRSAAAGSSDADAEDLPLADPPGDPGQWQALGGIKGDPTALAVAADSTVYAATFYPGWQCIQGCNGAPYWRGALSSLRDGKETVLIPEAVEVVTGIAAVEPGGLFIGLEKAGVQRFDQGDLHALGALPSSAPLQRIALGDGALPYALLDDGAVLRWSGAQWDELRQRDDDPAYTRPLALAAAADGSAYVALGSLEPGHEDEVVVERFNGSEWQSLADPVVHYSGFPPSPPSLTIAPDGTLYLASYDTESHEGQGAYGPTRILDAASVVIMAYREEGWVRVGEALSSWAHPPTADRDTTERSRAGSPLQVASDGTLYVAHLAAVGSATYAFVSRWTGSEWRALGAALYGAHLETPPVITVGPDDAVYAAHGTGIKKFVPASE